MTETDKGAYLRSVIEVADWLRTAAFGGGFSTKQGAFWAAFDSGRMLLFASAAMSEHRHAAGPVDSEAVTCAIRDGGSALHLSPGLIDYGVAYELFDQQGRENRDLDPPPVAEVLWWVDEVRTAFVRKFARYLISAYGPSPITVRNALMRRPLGARPDQQAPAVCC